MAEASAGESATPVTIDRALVERTATLARLALGEEELDEAAAELARILHYVEMLAEVDTTGVEPMTHGLRFDDDFRGVVVADAIGDELSRQAALANAPKHDGERYLVPAVLE